MSSSSGPTMTSPPSELSYATEEVEGEEHEAILEDLSDNDTDSDDTKKKRKKAIVTMTKRNKKKPSYLNTMRKNTSIPPWVVKTSKCCLPWPLDAIQ